MSIFRIHGDNIVECERIANLIISGLEVSDITPKLISPSTPSLIVEGSYEGAVVDWELILLPGFNKNSKKRWNGDIFLPLREAGGFFSETPDVILTRVNDDSSESILLAIEFCSALQAGNQAWQRSARAFSVGRTGCPYLYIVDFVKYELNNSDRTRKNLRFPNAAVTYSYINYTQTSGNFVAQIFTKSEEFNRGKETLLADFEEGYFGYDDLVGFILKTMQNIPTNEEKRSILDKSMSVVGFLSRKSKDAINLTAKEWREIYYLSSKDIIGYSVSNNRFKFHKTIEKKSHHGKTKEFLELLDDFTVGLASRDLPVGIIPDSKRKEFATSLGLLYTNFEQKILDRLADDSKHLAIALYKGFKPRGDDARPDRGLLPFLSMLTSPEAEILTFIYGPILERNLDTLLANPESLAKRNGLWLSTLALSNYLILDSMILNESRQNIQLLLDTSNIKNKFLSTGSNDAMKPSMMFSNTSIKFGEDDVDTAIHYFFTRLLDNYTFEGLCNPPGGDWSGFSVLHDGIENRWLSLPRVSDVVDGKRPDHIIEIFSLFQKPVLLTIESKEKSRDLEENVGIKLKSYIKHLLEFVPSAVRGDSDLNSEWTWGSSKVDYEDFKVISAAAYLRHSSESHNHVFLKKCEILFILDPINDQSDAMWNIEIVASSKETLTLKEFIVSKHAETGDSQFLIS